ncbi:sialidase family protein [Flavobacterium sp. ARAG 55.4]|uniref:sialidase family protein n=1 Tax=Flavobacterium sp. ARAG 55.4 TaxID=3451357 RepID=UPI003F4691BA
MKALIMLLSSIFLLLSCQVESDNGAVDVIDFVEVPSPILDGKVQLDTTQKVISYPEAGVNFISGHITNLDYLKREATQIPAVQVDTNDVLYCAWYSNSSTKSQHGEGAGSYATLAVSIDNGVTWLENRLIIAPIDENDCIFDPGLWMDPLGNIHFIWNKALNWWDEKGGVWETTISYDNRWIINTGPKILIENGVMSNKPTLLDGLGHALYGNFHYNFSPNAQAKTYLYTADVYTGGSPASSPILCSEIPIMPSNLKTVYSEPQFLQVGDSLSCYIREENSGIYFAKASLNNLKSWTLFKPLTSIGENAAVKFYIGRLMSGNILLVTCNDKTRKNMTAFLSKDNGVTFPYKLLIDSRDKVSYPDVSQGKDGTIYLVYDRERNIAKEILFTKFTENNIINNQKVTVKKVNSF